MTPIRLSCRLGIDAVYHLTDLPSVVSGFNIMYLDPHCQVLLHFICISRVP
jgi:hypothetical protein